jgi:hypothetical protein
MTTGTPLGLLHEYLKKQSDARSAEELRFYAAVGKGISNWSKMEERLVGVVGRLLRTTEPKAGLVMYSIINFYTWIQIIDDLFAIDGTYPKSLKLWRGMKEQLKAENDVRVRLAHHAMFEDGLAQALGVTAQFRLQAARLDTRTKTRGHKPLSTTEIEDFSERVAKLHVRVRVLLLRMKKRKSLR